MQPLCMSIFVEVGLVDVAVALPAVTDAEAASCLFSLPLDAFLSDLVSEKTVNERQSGDG